jgi:hypothetical protein
LEMILICLQIRNPDLNNFFIYMRKIFLIFAWLIIFLTTLVGIGFTETIKFSSQTINENRLRIILQWPASLPTFKAEVDGSDLTPINLNEIENTENLQGSFLPSGKTLKGKSLVLRFDEPIETPGIDRFVKEILVWIDNIKTGYDSLLLRATRNSAFHVSKAANQIIIQIEQLPVKAETQGVEDDRDLAHLESALLLQTNKFDAHSGITKLLKTYPEDPILLADLAEADNRLGRWRQSIEHYEQAIRRVPDTLYLKRSQSYLRSRSGPQVRVDQLYRDTANAEVQLVSRAMARQSYDSDFLVGVGFENRIINNNVLNPRIDGQLQVFKGNRQRWEGYVEKAHEFATTRLSLVGQEAQPGISLEHRRQLRLGEVSLKGIYHEPYWDFVEGIIDEGTADRLQLRWDFQGDSPLIGNFRSKNPFTTALGISANRYGVEDADNVAESIKVWAQLHYQLNFLSEGLSVGYQFSGEYVNLTDSRIDAIGSSFNPLAVQNRQTHFWNVSMVRHITDHTRFDFSTGYKFDDRVKSHGPFAALELVYDSFSNLEVGVNSEFNQETVRGSNDTFTQFGAFLIWKF